MAQESETSGEALELRIGRPPENWMRIQVLIRSHYGATDYWDANWLDCDVDINARPFSASFRATLRTDEFERFREGLKTAHEILTAGAVFESMEEWLTIEAKGDGLGHFTAHCQATAGPDRVNLRFEINFDQTDIPEMLRSLDAILEKFPVLWKASDKPR
jgi:hypothetical protein